MTRRLKTILCVFTSALVVSGLYLWRIPLYVVYCKLNGLTTITLVNDSHDEINDAKLTISRMRDGQVMVRDRKVLADRERWEVVLREDDIEVTGLEFVGAHGRPEYRPRYLFFDVHVRPGQQLELLISNERPKILRTLVGAQADSARDDRSSTIASDDFVAGNEWVHAASGETAPDQDTTIPRALPSRISNIVWYGGASDASFVWIELEPEVIVPILRRTLVHERLTNKGRCKCSGVPLLVNVNYTGPGHGIMYTLKLSSGILCGNSEDPIGCFRVELDDLQLLSNHLSDRGGSAFPMPTLPHEHP